jgi:proteic killer suppression protein
MGSSGRGLTGLCRDKKKDDSCYVVGVSWHDTKGSGRWRSEASRIGAARFSSTDDCPKGFPPDVVTVARRKLRALDAAVAVRDLAEPPGNRLEKLRANRAGQWSIRINDQWRICFIWKEDGAHEVEVVDYH